MLTLYIGNKNYSSWSMRPWVLMRQAGIAFEEVMLRFDSFDEQSAFKQRARALSPSGRVPVLMDEGMAIWDSLAICEYLAEKFPEKHLWPTLALNRARARSLCAEMHSGFGALRSLCPMNIEAQLPEVGARQWAENVALRVDEQHLSELWQPLLSTASGPMLYDQFSIVDAFFAPVCMRLATYELPVAPAIDAYARRVRALPGVQDWVQGALAEHDFRPFEEPYRSLPSAG
jgi:glutathione S-transferase